MYKIPSNHFNGRATASKFRLAKSLCLTSVVGTIRFIAQSEMRATASKQQSN